MEQGYPCIPPSTGLLSLSIISYLSDLLGALRYLLLPSSANLLQQTGHCGDPRIPIFINDCTDMHTEHVAHVWVCRGWRM